MNDKKKTTTTTTTTTTNASVDWLLDTTPILSFNKQHSVQLSSGAQVCPNLQPYELYHARNPCPSSTPRVYPKSCPLSQWCHLMLWCQLLLPLSIFPSIRVFSNQSVLCIRWPKCWSWASVSVSISDNDMKDNNIGLHLTEILKTHRRLRNISTISKVRDGHKKGEEN